MNNIAIIPARAGSKTIKNKNWKRIGNSTLVELSINNALRSKNINKIVVSSDDINWKNVTDYYSNDKVCFVKRPPEISADNSTSEECLIHCLDSMNEKYDYVVMMQPSSPIRRSNLIDMCFEEMLISKCDCLLTSLKLSNFMWSEKYDEKIDKWSLVSSYHTRKMKQDMGREDYLYHDNGNLYISDCSLLKKTKNRICGKVCVFPISPLESVQIDSYEDFECAKKIVIAGLVE